MSDTKLVLRDVADNERQAMLDTTMSAYREYKDGSPDGFWERYVANIEEAVLNATDTERLAIFDGTAMLASVLLTHKPAYGEDPEIRLLAVAPAARKLGLAKMLVSECERRVDGLGKSRVVLHTTALMPVARAWYERSGYLRFESIDFSPVPGFLVLDFAKELSSAKALSI